MPETEILLQEERLIRRGAESVDEIQLRLHNAEIELEEAYRCQLFDHIMVNNVFDQSVNQIFRLARDWYSRCCSWFNPTIMILALLLAPLWLGTLPFPPRRDCVCWWDVLKTWSPWFVRWEKIPLRFPLWRQFSCIYLAEWFFIALGFKVVGPSHVHTGIRFFYWCKYDGRSFKCVTTHNKLFFKKVFIII